MKTTCFCKKYDDIIVPELDTIITHRHAKNNAFIDYAWNERSVTILEREYPKVKRGEMKIIELSRKVGKSYSAVRNKVRRMGIN